MTPVETIRQLSAEIANQFNSYADHHEAKGATDKSLTNLRYRNKALEIVDILAELEAANAWQPIETLRKDMEVEIRGRWELRGHGVQFTHWRPLPTPPEDKT